MEQTFVCHVADLEEYDENGLTFQVNGEKISCPKYVEADGDIVPPEYEIQENDKIKIHSYYTVAQLLVYLEIEPETVMDIQVNGKQAELDTPLYGNFFVEWHRREQPAFPEGEENIQEEEAAFREDGFLGEGYAHGNLWDRAAGIWKKIPGMDLLIQEMKETAFPIWEKSS